MKRRVQLASPSAKNAQAYTFHDYCFDILKRHNRGFEVLDDYDLNILLRKRIRSLNLKHYVRAAKVGQFLKDLLEFMRHCQDELVTSAQYRAYVEALGSQKTTRGEVKIHRVAKSKDSDELTEEEALAAVRKSPESSRPWKAGSPTNPWHLCHMITRASICLTPIPKFLRKSRPEPATSSPMNSRTLTSPDPRPQSSRWQRR